MAEQTLTLQCTSSALLRNDTPSTNYHGTQSYQLVAYHGFSGYMRALLLGFDTFPAAYKYRGIHSVEFSFNYSRNLSSTSSFTIETITEPFDETTETWTSFRDDDMQFPVGIKQKGLIYFPSGSGAGSFSATIESTTNPPAQAAIKALRSDGLILRSDGTSRSDEYVDVYGSASSSRPHLLVRYDTEVVKSQISMMNSPTSGYINPRESNRFSWSYAKAAGEQYECMAESFPQAAATFYWREGTSGAWTSVQAAGSTQQILIPADTFPIGSSIQYYVAGTDEAGTTSTTATYTLSTTAAPAVATPVSPIGTVEDGSAEILLRWETTSDDGFPQNGADLQTSTDGATWTDLGHVNGTVTQYTAPAGTFLGGTAYWRVRAYNIDNAVGEWSAPATFVSVAAPPAPVVSVEAVPFATINWQAEGQQAWRVTVDGRIYGPYFGLQKSFTLPDPLEDGQHTALVDVQGSFGLWSQAGTATFTVANVPGDAVSLSGIFYRDAVLSWETQSQTEDFLIYRDGVQIGHTSGSSFTDRVTLGTHSWRVINRLTGGMYTASDTVQGDLMSCGLAIAPLAGGEWLELTKSASSTREIQTTISQMASIRHFAGETWPSAELAPYKDLQAAFDVAWLQSEKNKAAAFEGLIGKTVILKAPDGSCLVGLLSAVSRSSRIFYRAYTASVTRVHWRDFVDDAND